MNELHASESLGDVAPNVITYSTLMLCHGLSRLPGAPQRCDEIMALMDELFANGQITQPPNKKAFQTLRKAWSSSNEVNKGERIDAIRQEMERRFGTSNRTEAQGQGQPATPINVVK